MDNMSPPGLLPRSASAPAPNTTSYQGYIPLRPSQGRGGIFNIAEKSIGINVHGSEAAGGLFHVAEENIGINVHGLDLTPPFDCHFRYTEDDASLDYQVPDAPSMFDYPFRPL
jgi:hypothetical protein